MTDLFFSNLQEREIQYNARNSVADFDACMKEYARLAQKSKDAITGLYNLHYGLARRETLDIFPAKKQPSPILSISMEAIGGHKVKMMLALWLKIL